MYNHHPDGLVGTRYRCDSIAIYDGSKLSLEMVKDRVSVFFDPFADRIDVNSGLLWLFLLWW